MSIQIMKQAQNMILKAALHVRPTCSELYNELIREAHTIRVAIAEAERQEPVAEVTCFGHDADIHPMITYNARLMCNFEAGNYHLYTHPQPAIPVGWQLVPVEPTKEMLDAVSKGLADGYLQYRKIRCARDYKIMLAAVPKPENSHE